MFIIFNKTTKTIQSYGSGTPIETENILYLGSEAICNDLTVCSWKYIADQILDQDENGTFPHNADYYDSITPPSTIEERLAALEAAIQHP